MEENARRPLEAAGIDVDEALARFMGNEALLAKFLLRFPADENFPLLCRAMEQSDPDGAFQAAHTLKGVVGNLSMTGLFRQVSALVEDLRQGDLPAAEARMPALQAQYDTVIAALNALD